MNKKQKRTFTAGILTLSLAASVAQGTDVVAASKKLNCKKITLSRGNCYNLKVNGTSGKVTWKSSNKKIATVSKKGKVTAKKTGTAKITATVKSQKFTCKVTVRKPSCGSGTTIRHGSEMVMVATVLPPC